MRFEPIDLAELFEHVVRMKGMSATAEIVSIDGNKAEVSSGILKMNVKLNQLEKVGEKPKQPGKIEKQRKPKKTNETPSRIRHEQN